MRCLLPTEQHWRAVPPAGVLGPGKVWWWRGRCGGHIWPSGRGETGKSLCFAMSTVPCLDHLSACLRQIYKVISVRLQTCPAPAGRGAAWVVAATPAAPTEGRCFGVAAAKEGADRARGAGRATAGAVQVAADQLLPDAHQRYLLAHCTLCCCCY
jgi:hypothetical protein